MKLLRFTAKWCGPCKAISPTIEKVCQELSLTTEVIDIELPEGIVQATKYNIRAVPTFVLVYPDGTEISRKVGAGKESEYQAWLKRDIGHFNQ